MQPIKLLLVEDDEDDFIIARDLLNEIDAENYELIWANNLHEARIELTSNFYDVCLVDYTLGSEDGLSLLTEAKNLNYNCPFIMLTGQDNPQLDKEALNAGAVDYLVKSQLNASRLARAIRYAVARREMEQERVERLRAESENRAKSEFLAHLSHELRTPLTAILGYTDLLNKEATSDDQIQHLQVIKRNGRHLLNLLNDILDLTKIEAGRLEIDRQSISLPLFLSDLYQLMQVKAIDKNIEFHFLATSRLPEAIITDATRLRQILMNLIGNAIKFTDQGSVQLRINSTIENGHLSLEFAVIDSGIGISANEFDKLFRPFSQTNNINSRSERGTGLGLAISRQLASCLGGDISVTSEENIGSTFTLKIDAGDPAGVKFSPLNLNLMHELKTEASIRNLHANIMVVDDLADVRNLTGFFLESAGANVFYADNGQSAVTSIVAAESSDQPIDLVLMDMQMPGMTGIEATQQLRKQGYSKPVLALTAATMKGERERCLEAGCSDHLSKPIEEFRLLERVMYYLNDSQTAPQEPATSKKLLLIEDDHDTRTVTSLLIQSIGWEVIEAANASEATAALANHTFNLVLMDINLPDANGNDLAAEFKQASPQLKIIALTGSDLMDIDGAVDHFDQHVLKPISMDQLTAMLG